MSDAKRVSGGRGEWRRREADKVVRRHVRDEKQSKKQGKVEICKACTEVRLLFRLSEV